MKTFREFQDEHVRKQAVNKVRIKAEKRESLNKLKQAVRGHASIAGGQAEINAYLKRVNAQQQYRIPTKQEEE